MNHDDEDVLRDELRAIASWGDPDDRPDLDDLAAKRPVSGGSARSDRSRWLAAAALTAAAAIFIVAFIATRDGDETEVLTGPAATTAPANDNRGEPVEARRCEQVESFAASMHNLGITADYSPTGSPEALAQQSDLLVRGQLTQLRHEPAAGDPVGPYLVFTIRVDDVLRHTGGPTVADEIEMSAMFNPAHRDFAEIEESFVAGVPVVAFLDAGPWPGGWAPSLEGFWIACDDQHPARSVLTNPSWWTPTGTLVDLIAATTLETTAPETSPPTTPPATEPTIDGESLPPAGVAIRRDAGPLTLLDLDGNVLGTADATNVPVNTRDVSIGVGSPPQLGPTVPVAAEVPPGCDSASADGGVHVALCGGETGRPRRIERVDPAGGSTEISGPPPLGDADAVRGHWRWAEPSPDGRWVLAAWSGECESLTGFLFSTDGENDLTAVGSPIDEWQTSPEAAPLGWTPDGRAIVAHGHGLCGASAAEPGVHLMDPTTGTTERIYQSEIADGFLTWTRRYPWGNGLEYLAIQALDDLGFEQCCGEPSHGGPDATIGAVFEGTNIAILGAPIEDSALSGVESAERIPFGLGQAVVFDGDAGRSIAFACGNNTWTLVWRTMLDPPPVDVDKMLRLGEALLPHLACTLGSPPT